MLEVFSTNQVFTPDSAIPLNNITIQKGCTAILGSPATIELNRSGVYMVSCDAFATGTAAGVGTIQMFKNGVAQRQAITTDTLTATTPITLGFNTLVQVRDNNSCSCCTSPTTLQFVYTGTAATGHINVCVTKIC